MSFFEILKYIFVYPLEYVFEAIYKTAYYITGRDGVAILIMSIVVCTLLLPLNRRAEKLEDEQRKKEEELARWVNHIKKNFHGDEKYMVLSAYYKENHYNPISQLRSSISLLLQIPFLLAAYDLLAVRAISRFWGTGGDLFFFELAHPDRLVEIGSVTLNLLPILMTMLNILTAYIYTKGYPFKVAARSYILALVFLVLLYNCPSVLLVYWTMNNLYALIKVIIIKKMQQSKPEASSDEAADSPSEAPVSQTSSSETSGKKRFSLLKGEPNTGLFVLSALYMAVMTGLMIPLSILSASPSEFVTITDPLNPLTYLCPAFCVAIGFFVLWPGVFYYLASKPVKKVFSALMFGVAVFATVNSLFFGKSAGSINTSLLFETKIGYDFSQIAINLLVFVAIISACFLLYRFRRAVKYVVFGGIMAILTISFMNAKKVQDSYDSIMDRLDTLQELASPKITLSEDGQNVMVIMLDKAISGYVPYVFHEFPELERQFDGFTYYPNTMSFGPYTLQTTSALFGGYEYTPERMNARSDELLSVKHDESLKVLPELFSREGYASSLMDLPFAGWTWQGDYSAFEDIENCSTYYAKDFYNNDTETHTNRESRRMRNFFMYSIFKSVPLCAQSYIYDSGNYLAITRDRFDSYIVTENYKVLEQLDDMTIVDKNSKGNLLLFNNHITHDYQPLINYDPYNMTEDPVAQLISDGDDEHLLTLYEQIGTYDCLVVALRELGNYMDHLRELGVYDNTRIIIVSDHGTDIDLFDHLHYEKLNVERLNCLLMVKDFNSTGFKTDYTFMTNADVPTIALEGIVKDPVNPYTGKPLNSDLKFGDLYAIYTDEHAELNWNPEYNNGTVFNQDIGERWFKLNNQNIFEEDNWIPVEKPEVE